MHNSRINNFKNRHYAVSYMQFFLAAQCLDTMGIIVNQMLPLVNFFDRTDVQCRQCNLAPSLCGKACHHVLSAFATFECYWYS